MKPVTTIPTTVSPLPDELQNLVPKSLGPRTPDVRRSAMWAPRQGTAFGFVRVFDGCKILI
jgi:hypothetical protein